LRCRSARCVAAIWQRCAAVIHDLSTIRVGNPGPVPGEIVRKHNVGFVMGNIPGDLWRDCGLHSQILLPKHHMDSPSSRKTH
jgi:hypothetical protein